MKIKSVLSTVLTTILILIIMSAVASAHDGCSIECDPEAQLAGDPLSYVIDDILADGESVFLFFYADWCPHCHHQMPIIDELESEYAGEVTFIKINVTERPDHAAEFGVSALPMMIIISGKNGEEYVREEISGFTEKTRLREIVGSWTGHESCDASKSTNENQSPAESGDAVGGIDVAAMTIQPVQSFDLMAPDSTPITTRPSEQSYPAIAHSRQEDEYLVLWQDNTYVEASSSRRDVVPSVYIPYNIYARRVRNDGTPLGSEFGIASTNLEYNPAVAYNPTANEYLIVWEHSFEDSYDTDIYARRVNCDGALVGGEIAVAVLTNVESAPDIAYNSVNDEYLIVWERREGSGGASHLDVYGQRLDSDGSLLGEPILIGYGLQDQLAPAVAYGSINNQYSVVWQDHVLQTVSEVAATNTPFEFDIYGQQIGCDGSLIGNQIAISTWEYDQVKPRLAFNSAANEFLVVWEDHHWGWGEDWDIYGQRVNADGMLAGDNFAISWEGANHRESPDVAYTQDADEYIVVWEYEYSPDDHDVYYRRVGSDGTLLEDEIAVSAHGSHEGMPALASGGDRSCLIVWGDGRDAETQGMDIYGGMVRPDMLSGRVYKGEVGDESTPLGGVTVELYCSNDDRDLGTLITSTATDSEGWYGLPVAGVCEFYNILETDPAGYMSVGSTSVGGTVVTSNWIQYEYPLDGKTLTGNRFWDRPVSNTVECYSCEDCTNKLESGLYEQVILTADITDHAGSCISLLFGEGNVVFDCNGHTIDGDDTAIDPDHGVAMMHGTGNTIKNCVISDFSKGIYLWNATNHAITNNTVTSDGAGIELGFSDSNNINNNRVNDNYNGIIIDNSNSNTINANIVCMNTNLDFSIVSGSGNSGNNNYCDKPDGWNDAGTTGCTYTCPIGKPDLVITDVWNEGSIVWYQIRNIGEAVAPGGHCTALFVDGVYRGEVCVGEDLAPGAGMERCFEYGWECSPPEDVVVVRADYKDDLVEKDETNNLMGESWECVGTPSLERTFGGTVYMVESGEEGQPLRGARVSLYGSAEASELGELLATTHAGLDGTFMLLVFTNPDEDFPYYFLALNDPNYAAVETSPGPDGEVVGAQWIRFTHPAPGDYWDNRFNVEPSGEEPVPTELPSMVPFSAGPCPPASGPQPSPPVADLSILGIEVTQATQCFDQSKGYTKCPDNSLELTDGKATAVRVYIGHEGGPKCQPGSPSTPVLKGVCVKLRWAAPHTDLPPGSVWIGEEIEQCFDVPCSKELDKLRENTWGSATFILQPEALGKPGWKKSLWVEAEVIANGIEESDPNNNLANVSVHLIPREPLKVEWILIEYRPDPPAVPNSNIFADPNAVGSSSGLIKATYPSVEYSWGGCWLVYDGKKCSDCYDIRFDDQGWSNRLIIKLGYARELMKPKPDALIGWLPVDANAYSGVRGLGGNCPPVAWGVQDTFLQNEIILAHEIGHTQGIEHVNEIGCPSKIIEAGFSIADKSVIPGSTGDFMRSSAGSGWISPYVWNRLLGKVSDCPPASTTSTSFCEEELPPPLEMQATSLSAAAQPAILVSGRVIQDGSGELDTPYRVSSEGPFSTTTPAGEYCLDFETLTGSTLDSHCFNLSFTELCGTGAPINMDGFFFNLPFPSETGRLVLRRGSTVLAERIATPHAPELAVRAPQGGGVISGPITINWTASDEDGDPLQFAVLYSPNGGDSWSPMAIHVEGTSLEVDSIWWAGGENAQIRILASDGFNVASVDSDIFQVPRKAPNVWIFSPENNAIFHPFEAIVLTGHADDLEDGELDDSNLIWASDRHGVLGSGSQLILPGMTLDPGIHEIMLTATDSDGRTATDRVTMFVGQCVTPTDDLYINSDTILCPGVYNIPDSGAEGVIIINASDIVLDCNGATINGTMTGSDYGIYSRNFDNVTIKNCNVMNYLAGIELEMSSNSKITHNNLSSNRYGIYLFYSDDSIITSNTANSNRYKGIGLASSSNNLVANNIANTNGDGIFMGSFSSNNRIEGNTASSNRQAGIYIYGNSSSNNFSNNKINNNLYGIYLGSCICPTCSHYCPGGNFNNTIKANKISNNEIGIFSNQSDSMIDSNAVCDNIELDFDSPDWLTSSGDNNTCNKPDGWNDSETTGCTYSCPPSKGDLNGDGKITPTDAAIALQFAASGEYDPAADVDCDGQITALDALMILQAAAGNIELQGCES